MEVLWGAYGVDVDNAARFTFCRLGLQRPYGTTDSDATIAAAGYASGETSVDPSQRAYVAPRSFQVERLFAVANDALIKRGTSRYDDAINWRSHHNSNELEKFRRPKKTIAILPGRALNCAEPNHGASR